MAQHRITHVRLSAGGYAHEHIIAVKNSINNWEMTREEVIRQIDGNINSFYVVDPRNSSKFAFVGVVRSVGKNPYIRTYADGDYNDNLLSLPRF